MITKFCKFLAIAMVAVVSGCASTVKMPLNDKATDANVSQNSILWAKVTIQNQKSTSHQPEMCCMFVGAGDEMTSYTDPILVKENAEAGKEYLISFVSKPGKNKIALMRFVRHIPMVMRATADLPMDQEIDVPANSVVYLGNITAVIRDKKSDDEPSAGPLLPLLDQSLAGFYTGTFEVTVADNFEADSAELKQRFAYMKQKESVKMVLPAWVHPEMKSKAAK